MLFMNTVLTRGRAEMIVTATGMSTQVGAIAEGLRTGQEPPSPLQVQLDSLGRRLALVGGIAVAGYAGLALVRGESVADLLLRVVALAVAAVPEGPAGGAGRNPGVGGAPDGPPRRDRQTAGVGGGAGFGDGGVQ